MKRKIKKEIKGLFVKGAIMLLNHYLVQTGAIALPRVKKRVAKRTPLPKRNDNIIDIDHEEL